MPRRRAPAAWATVTRIFLSAATTFGSVRIESAKRRWVDSGVAFANRQSAGDFRPPIHPAA